MQKYIKMVAISLSMVVTSIYSMQSSTQPTPAQVARAQQLAALAALRQNPELNPLLAAKMRAAGLLPQKPESK